MICYLLLVLIGWINIYASIHSTEPSSILDWSARSGKQAIWMLTIEWLEKEQKCVIDNRKEIVAKLSPIFFNDESEASSFLSEIQDMKPKQITDMVNKLVRARIISEMSRKRELWSVLHDYGLYEKSESNWNSQVG